MNILSQEKHVLSIVSTILLIQKVKTFLIPSDSRMNDDTYKWKIIAFEKLQYFVSRETLNSIRMDKFPLQLIRY